MYYIAVKDKKDNYIIDAEVEDWRSVVGDFEPIDCINGEILIYDEQGHKYFVGPNKNLEKTKLFGKISAVEVGSWDFKKGEPFLIDTNLNNIGELQKLLKTYNKHS